ncbi:hypothetical protein [Streptomyces sp. ICBB 8177]|uniref:hypothetical protein n=1 Tax=Streptomyces sp. ICBB 8177 TaxID=563922 RepID=UPI0013053B44|nr:hypothetical protein [Streptomyces sp. ICBB 8177]
MAQDGFAAFHVGIDDKTLCCTDANGVALVSIRALYRRLTETQQEVTALRTLRSHLIW